MFEFLKYTIWPEVKVRLKVFFLSAKYGGKKNIPPEIIFAELQKNMEGLKKNLEDAFRAAPDNISNEEKKQMLEALQKTAELDGEINNVIRESRQGKLENKN